MKKLDVRHYLDIYQVRKEMQEEGITKPSEDYIKFTNDLVEKLEKMPLDKEIVLKENGFYDVDGNLQSKLICL